MYCLAIKSAKMEVFCVYPWSSKWRVFDIPSESVSELSNEWTMLQWRIGVKLSLIPPLHSRMFKDQEYDFGQCPINIFNSIWIQFLKWRWFSGLSRLELWFMNHEFSFLESTKFWRLTFNRPRYQKVFCCCYFVDLRTSNKSCYRWQTANIFGNDVSPSIFADRSMAIAD